MAKKIQQSLTPWLSPLEARRARIEAPQTSVPVKGALGAPELPPAGGSSGGSPSVRSDGSPGAPADLAALELAKKKLAPHQKKQLELALKKLASLTSAQLALAPDDPRGRAAIAEGLVRDFRLLVERSGSSPSATAAIYAALGIVDAGIRHQAASRLSLSPEGAAGAMGEAARDVRALIDALAGRTGIAHALNIYANLVEQLELASSAPLSAELRGQVRAEVSAFLAAVSDSFTPAIVAELVRAAGAAIEARPNQTAAEVLRAAGDVLGSTGSALSSTPPVASPRSAPGAQKSPLGSLPPRVQENISRAAASTAAEPTTAGPQLEAALIKYARSLGPDATLDVLSPFAERYQRAAALLEQAPSLKSEAAAIAAELAKHPSPMEVVIEAAVAAKNALRGAPIASLLATTTDGSPGLLELADPASDYRNPPLAYLPKLLETPGLTEDGVRAAMRVASNIGRVGLDNQRYADLVRDHFARAIAEPNALVFASRGRSQIDLRSQETQKSLPAFMRAHPELPAEVAATAALFATPDQLGWLCEEIGKNARSLDFARLMRDFVFGAVDAGRTDLIEAARTSRSSPKVIRRVEQELARAFRQGTLGALNFDVLVEGLKAGRDPLADLQRAKDSGEINGIDLVALAGGKLAPQGRAELLASKARLNYLLGLYVDGGASYDRVNMLEMRAVLLESMKAVATGDWPRPKYENQAGQRIMSILSGDQQEVWKQPTITPLSTVQTTTDDPAIHDAMVLLSGLRAAMPQAIELGGENIPPIGWNRPSIENLSAMREYLLAELKTHQKGSPEYRDIRKNISAVLANLSLLELFQALEGTIGAGEKDPAAIMGRVRPALLAAKTELSRRGGEGFLDTAEQILFATQELKASPREGRYAIDEDSFFALATSHTSGCLSPHWSNGAPGRQWGLAGAIADANIRMLRVMDGDQQRARGFIKFFQVSMPGYDGPMLWLDPPKPDGGGDNDDITLWYIAAVHKAVAMGIPIATGRDALDPTGYHPELLAEAGASMGLEVRDHQTIRVSADDGNTGVMHSDNLMNGFGDIRVNRGAHPTWDFDAATRCVVMPKKVGS